jgi:predicted TIM-barrel fold metal-dependent hydrolase
MDRNLRIISADSHVVEPMDLWETRMDAKYRDRAPRIKKNNIGRWVISAEDCTEFPVAALYAAGKRGAELRALYDQGYEAGRPGGWDPVERIKDQDVDGVLAEVLYTSNGMPLYGIQDPELQMASFRAFNDWLSEYCSASPKRLYGIALISLADVAAGVKELERCARMGLRGAMISNDPRLTYDNPVYHPFWSAASDLGMPISLHIITTSKKQDPSKTYNRAQVITMRMNYVNETQCSLAVLLHGGVLEQFPRLRIVSTENDIGWIAYFLHRLDRNYDTAFLSRQPPLKPSEYARRQLWATFQDDPPGVALYKFFGEDNFMWASDYPHTDSTWPESRKVIDQNFASIPEPVVRKIVYNNVQRLYGIDLN